MKRFSRERCLSLNCSGEQASYADRRSPNMLEYQWAREMDISGLVNSILIQTAPCPAALCADWNEKTAERNSQLLNGEEATGSSVSLLT